MIHTRLPSLGEPGQGLRVHHESATLDPPVHTPGTACMYTFLVQLLSCVQLFETSWTATCQATCPSPSPGVFSNSCPLIQWCCSTISSSLIPFSSCLQSFPASGSFPRSCIGWPKYWSFSFSISHSNEYSGLISFKIHWFDLLVVQGTLKSRLQHHSSKHQFFSAQLSFSPTLTSTRDYWKNHSFD